MLSRLIRYGASTTVSIIPNNNKLFPPVPSVFVSYLRSFCSMTSSCRLPIYPANLPIYLFNHMLSSLQKRGNLLAVLQLFERWENSLTCDSVFPNIDTRIILIHCHTGIGNMRSAFSLFHKIIEIVDCPTTSTLYDLFNGLCIRGQVYKAFVFYKYTMLKGFQLNHSSYVILSNRLCQRGETKIAIHLLRESLDPRRVNNDTLCTMYYFIILRLCKERHLNEAYDLFSEMIVKKIEPCPMMYACLVYGYCITGQFKQAIALFREFGEDRKKNLVTKQEVRTAKLVTKQEVEAAKRAVAVLIKRGVKPDLASCQSVIGGLYNGGRVRVTRKVEELSLQFYRSSLANYIYFDCVLV